MAKNRNIPDDRLKIARFIMSLAGAMVSCGKNHDSGSFNLTEIEANLFSFVDAHQNEIRLAKEIAALRPTEIPGPVEAGTFRKLIRGVVKQRTDSGNENLNRILGRAFASGS